MSIFVTGVCIWSNTFRLSDSIHILSKWTICGIELMGINYEFLNKYYYDKKVNE